jgi:hypothetical protein
MPDFLDKLVEVCLPICEAYAKNYMNEKINELIQMAGIKSDKKITLKELSLIGDPSFQQECKLTIMGRKDNSLEVIISHPEIENISMTKKNALEYDGFSKKGKISKIQYKDKSYEVNFELNPQDSQYTFKAEVYVNKKAYQQAVKLHRAKNQ